MKPEFIDHVVLVVKDVLKTESFYSSFLGSPEMKNKEHVAYKIGNTKIFFVLPYKDYKSFDKDAGGINHFAFGVQTIEELKSFETILNQIKIQNSGIQIDKYSNKEFIWFDDPDGYRLEFYLRPNEQNKNFIGWFQVKEKIGLRNHKPPLFKDGEVWWCHLGENIGVEINGKGDMFTRPILILKKYDKYSFLGLPLSTKIKKGTWYVQVMFEGKTQTIGLAQGRVFDYRRFKEKIGQMEEVEMEKVHSGFKLLHTFSNHRPPDISAKSRGKPQI